MNGLQSGSRIEKQMTFEEMLSTFGAPRFSVLATSDNGRLYTSLTAFALTPDLRTLILATPKATSKYLNITSRPAVSTLLDNRSQCADDLQSAQAVRLLGTAKEVRATVEMAQYSVMFLDKHPELAAFIDEPDTALIAVTIKQAVHVSRFQDTSHWP